MTGRVRRVARVAVRIASLAGLALGCATGAVVPLPELPADPIALVYWDPETARRRNEAVEQWASADPTRMGVAPIESVAALFGLEAGRQRDVLDRFPGRIALLDPRSLELSVLAAAPAGARPVGWSRDRRKLLFASPHLGQRLQLYAFDRQTGEVHPLTRGDRHHLDGDWGPDGELVVSWIEPRGSSSSAGLDRLARAGGEAVPLLKGAYASDVRWSPRGDVLVYVQAPSLPPRSGAVRDESAVVVRAPVPQAVASVLTRGREPVFSPDGEWIVYSTQTREGWRLARMRSDGSARAGLAGGRGLDERNPAVSPDGRFVAYVVTEAGTARLCVRRMDGTGERILFSDGGVADPVW